MVTLAPGERLCEPGAQDLLRRLGATFATTVLHAQLDDHLRERPAALLALVTVPHEPKPVPNDRLNRFNGHVERLYNDHAHRWMDWYRGVMQAKVRDAMELWRSRYGITEDDQALWTAEKAYLRYRKRNNQVLHHGGARYGPRYR
jgi:hypothetical protein